MISQKKPCLWLPLKGNSLPDIRHQDTSKTVLYRPKTANKRLFLGHLTNRNKLLYSRTAYPDTGKNTCKKLSDIISYPSFQVQPQLTL